MSIAIIISVHGFTQKELFLTTKILIKKKISYINF